MAHSRDSLLGIIELAGQPEKSYLGAKGLGGGGGRPLPPRRYGPMTEWMRPKDKGSGRADVGK